VSVASGVEDGSADEYTFASRKFMPGRAVEEIANDWDALGSRDPTDTCSCRIATPKWRTFSRRVNPAGLLAVLVRAAITETFGEAVSKGFPRSRIAACSDGAEGLMDAVVPVDDSPRVIGLAAATKTRTAKTERNFNKAPLDPTIPILRPPNAKPPRMAASPNVSRWPAFKCRLAPTL
jgi:hypothetical protein